MVIDLEGLMNMKDVRDIHIKLRKKFPPDSELTPILLQQIVDVMLEHISEGDKAEGQITLP